MNGARDGYSTSVTRQTSRRTADVAAADLKFESSTKPDQGEWHATIPEERGGNALHGDFSPEQPGSAMFGWVLSSLAQTVGYPIPEGGSGELTGALVSRLQSLGGTIACDARVTTIEVRRGRAVAVRTGRGHVVTARRAVLADVGAPQLYSTLLARDHVPAPMLRALQHFEYGNSTFKVDFALDGAIPWLHPDTGRAGTVHITPGLDALTRGATEIALRRIPAEPFLVTGQYAQADPTRMPHGKEVFWAYTHVPQHFAGDAGDAGEARPWEFERRRSSAELSGPRGQVIGVASTCCPTRSSFRRWR